ncbi:MAG: hypothetical protein VXY23_19445, partial [Pseudomonadota bacterium]|nr:hypothetical protein [Pseudomonadota bacterium]
LSLYFGRNIEAKPFDRLAFRRTYPNLKICQDCLVKNKVIPFYWYLDDYKWCHIHREHMVLAGTKRNAMETHSQPSTHPIIDFLNAKDPALSYFNLLSSAQELRWLCWCLKKFSETHQGRQVNILSAMRCIDCALSDENDSDDRFDRITKLIAEQSSQSVKEVRLLSSLFFWQRLVLEQLFQPLDVEAEVVTEPNLGLASRQLIANEPMLMFVCDAHPQSISNLHLRGYISLFSGLEEATGRSLQNALYYCGLISEVLVTHSSCGTKFEFELEIS